MLSSDVISGGGVEGLNIDEIVGVPGGPIFGFGMNDSYRIDGDTSTRLTFRLRHAHVVNEVLGYAQVDGPRLAVWDGSEWTPFSGDPVPYEFDLVWADEESIYCAGSEGVMLSLEAAEWFAHDVGTMASITTLWGSSGEDVWAGTVGGGLLRYDGSSWESMDWPDSGDDSDQCHTRGDSIHGMWGIGGVVFFHTGIELFMWDGADFRVLAYWPGTYLGPDDCDGRINIQSIWGNSETELFLAVYDEDHYERACGEDGYVLWWDGTEFHWF